MVTKGIDENTRFIHYQHYIAGEKSYENYTFFRSL